MHTPLQSPINQAVNTQTHFLDTATPWKVYSRTRGCHKQGKEGRGIKEAQIFDTDPQNMTCQWRKNTKEQKKQQTTGNKEEMSQDPQENDNSGNTENKVGGEQTTVRENRKKEAATIWDVAKNLGINEVED